MKKIIRYIGSKEKLLPFLDEVIFDKLPENTKILDAFTGTTVVSKHIQEKYNFEQYLSDFSDYSEILSSRLFLNKTSENVLEHLEHIIKISKDFCDIEEGIFFNEFSINGLPKTLDQEILSNQTIKSRMFFTEDVGLKIDTMRSYIKELYNNKIINDYDKNLLLMAVLAFADKNANTTSVYGAYLKKQNRETMPLTDDFLLTLMEDKKRNDNSPKCYYKGDIIKTLESIPEMDVIYFDPPYNTRKYESNYHILNYLCSLDFNEDMIKYNSKTGLPKVSVNNDFGSKKGTRKIFQDMIEKGLEKAPTIYISYSSEGEMTLEEIEKICIDNNFVLLIHEKLYKKYKSKNIEQKNELKEIIYEIKRK